MNKTSTLDRVESTENSVAELLATVSRLEQDVAALKDNVTKQANTTMQYLQFVTQKQLAMEQSSESLHKTLTAMVDELVSSGGLDSKKLMARIRTENEAADKKQLESLIAAGTVVAQDEALPTSIIAYSQELVKGELSETLADYRVIDLGQQGLSEKIVSGIVGKKVGDTVEFPGNDGQVSVLKILAVYGLAVVERQGETSEPVSEGDVTLEADSQPETTVEA